VAGDGGGVLTRGEHVGGSHPGIKKITATICQLLFKSFLNYI